MRLTRVDIANFRSVQSTGFRLDPKITVLVGKNDVGKTNVLRSFLGVNPEFVLNRESDRWLRTGTPSFRFEFSHFTKDEGDVIRSIRRGKTGFSSIRLDVKFAEDGGRRAELWIDSTKIIDPRACDKISGMLPTATYLCPRDIQLIPDHIDVHRIPEEANTALLNLLKFCGLQQSTLMKSGGHRSQEVQRANESLNKALREYWQPDSPVPMRLELRAEGTLLVMQVHDSTGTIDLPTDRSEATWWFISLLFHLDVLLKWRVEGALSEHVERRLILLDEPGISLFPNAQRVLVSVLEKLAVSDQVILTTHLPFMIDRRALQRIRLVRKDVQGTVVDEKSHENAFRQMRKELGLLLGESLVFNEVNLIVEGITEAYLLGAVARVLPQTCRRLDYDRLSIIVPEDKSSAFAFAKLAVSEGLSVIMLHDNDGEGRHRSRKAALHGYPALQVGPPHDKVAGTDWTIEDMFPRTVYLEAARTFYRKRPHASRIGPGVWSSGETSPILDLLVKQMGLKHAADFNKRGVAEVLVGMLDRGTVQTESLLRFVELFAKIADTLAAQAQSESGAREAAATRGRLKRHMDTSMRTAPPGSD